MICGTNWDFNKIIIKRKQALSNLPCSFNVVSDHSRQFIVPFKKWTNKPIACPKTARIVTNDMSISKRWFFTDRVDKYKMCGCYADKSFKKCRFERNEVLWTSYKFIGTKTGRTSENFADREWLIRFNIASVDNERARTITIVWTEP